MQGSVPHADAWEGIREGAAAWVDALRRMVDVAYCHCDMLDRPSIVDRECDGLMRVSPC
jgi:hypothetical protein